MSWSELAEPTGDDDPRALMEEVKRVTLSLWRAIESTQRRLDEDETTWTRRRNEAYRELAPLLERVGRLNADVASVMAYEGSGGMIERVDRPHNERARALPQRPFPRELGDSLRPRVGMETLLGRPLGDDWDLLPLERDIQNRTVMISGNDAQSPQNVVSFLQELLTNMQLPNQSGNQNVSQSGSGNPSGSGSQNGNGIQNATQNDHEEHTHTHPTETTHILSDSVQQPQPSSPSLLYSQRNRMTNRKRLQSLGLIRTDASLPTDSLHHQNELQ